MVIYNKNRGGHLWPQTKTLLYKRTCFVINQKPFYWSDYESLIPDDRGWCIIQQISEKNWCTPEMVSDLFDLGVFLFPKVDYSTVAKSMGFNLKTREYEPK
jgi:hypothetical protein